MHEVDVVIIQPCAGLILHTYSDENALKPQKQPSKCKAYAEIPEAAYYVKSDTPIIVPALTPSHIRYQQTVKFHPKTHVILVGSDHRR